MVDPASLPVFRLMIEGIATAPNAASRRSLLNLCQTGFGQLDADSVAALASGIPVLVHCMERAARSGAWVELSGLCRLVLAFFQLSEVLALQWLQRVGALLVGVLLSSLNQMVVLNGPEVDSVSAVDAMYTLLEKISLIQFSLPTMARASDILKLFQQVVRNDGQMYSCSVQTETMRLLASLSQRSENIMIIVRYRFLVDDVLSAPNPLGGEFYTALLLRRLIWGTAHREDVCRRKHFVPKLLELCQSTHLPTLREVLRTLGCMALSTGSKLVLVQSQELMKQLAIFMMRPQFRPVTVAVVMHLIRSNEGALAVNLPEAVQALVRFDDASASGVAHSLKSLAANLGAWNRNYPHVIDGLIKLSGSSDRCVRGCVAKTFLEQSRVVSNAFYLVRAPDAMRVMLRLCCDADLGVQAYATEAVLNLASTTANQKRLLSYVDVLPTMVQKAMSFDNGCQWRSKTRRLAVRLILSLVGIGAARMRLAKELNLLLCLTKFAVSSDAGEKLKDAALNGVMILAPFL